MTQAKRGPDPEAQLCLYSPHIWVNSECLVPGKSELGLGTSMPGASAGSWNVFLYYQQLTG